MNWLKHKLKHGAQTSESGQTKSQVPTQSSIYNTLGGEAGVRRLADAFYDNMEQLPEAAELLAMHPQPMDSIRQRFFEFLSGWFGGPPLFEQKYGHPRLRARHLPFTVDTNMRDQWMLCMTRALDTHVTCPLTRMQLRQSFFQLADHMRNADLDG
ncbi:group II truncated hemoglobin [Neiella marina]|uniref:Group II truncated hemoglobin n=1 Tax=Neiella holothuriorum TaxID=2870530 RepID=A0ABS7ELQ1_9GAMM|nr:group II truncated hemoglobin [Neiella holothuriorum]MBW8192788.1 group II truncated hemoglobin [Neiella holothuriorum]